MSPDPPIFVTPNFNQISWENVVIRQGILWTCCSWKTLCPRGRARPQKHGKLLIVNKRVGGTSKQIVSSKLRCPTFGKGGTPRIRFIPAREMLNHQLCWSWFFVCTNFIAVPAGKIHMWSRKILKGPFQNANSLPVPTFFTGKLLVFGELNHTKIENHTQRIPSVFPKIVVPPNHPF